MSYYFPSTIFSMKEAEQIANGKLIFDSNGYLKDPNLTTQKAFEDRVEAPIMILMLTTQNTVHALMDPYGIVQTNPVTGKRICQLKGDYPYLKSVIDMMIQMHPSVPAQTIIGAYSFQCPAQDRLLLMDYFKKHYNAH